MNKLKVTFFLVLVIAFQNVWATSSQDLPAINMVSYEQSWLDHKGTIALKNNTGEDIHSVTFMLEYLDMQGNPMDYETYSYNIEIAPGMTKKLDIPAYEHDRYYHYYKTKDEFGHPSFKLRYELKDFNTLPQDSSENYVGSKVNDNYSTYKYDDEGSSWVDIPIVLIAILIVLGVYVGIYVLVAVMAQRRNRNPVIWLLLSFIATPLLICIILLVIGDNHNNEY